MKKALYWLVLTLSGFIIGFGLGQIFILVVMP